MRDLEALLKAGNAAQMEKLQENTYKRGSDDINTFYALRRLSEEVKELEDEFWLKEKDYKKIRREAADVANFAHMLIVACDKEIK